jgi:serralysin
MIKGGGSSLAVDAGAGNDIITLGDSNHSIDGGAGTDTAVFSGARAATP